MKIGWGLFLCFLLMLSCGQKKSHAPLRIAVAANFQPTAKVLAEQFQEKTGLPCELIIGASGKLTAQIQAGAPFDLFLAADQQYPEILHQAELTIDTPSVYAYGKLVLFAINSEFSLSVDNLSTLNVSRVAIPNPRLAPYGAAAKQFLQNQGLWDDWEPKLILGESVNQTNQFLATRSVDVGFTALASVLTSPLNQQNNWIEVPSHQYTPIAQSVVVLKSSTQVQAAISFRDFLLSGEARTVIRSFGYDY